MFSLSFIYTRHIVWLYSELCCPVAFTCDVEGMFHQVYVHPDF